jgi:hypothetical protein
MLSSEGREKEWSWPVLTYCREISFEILTKTSMWFANLPVEMHTRSRRVLTRVFALPNQPYGRQSGRGVSLDQLTGKQQGRRL